MRVFGLTLVLLCTFLSGVSAQTTPANPGTALLRAVKTVADSNRIDDPVTVGRILHLSFSLSGQRVDALPTCTAHGGWFENDYAVEGESRFHTLPSGISRMILPIDDGPAMAGLNVPGKVVQITDEPEIGYETFHMEGCPPGTRIPHAWLRAGISIVNIPPYSCISESDIKAVFGPKPGPATSFPEPGMVAEVHPDRTIEFIGPRGPPNKPGAVFLYNLSFPLPSPSLGITATREIGVSFWMTEQAGKPNHRDEPECLLMLEIESRIGWVGSDASF